MARSSGLAAIALVFAACAAPADPCRVRELPYGVEAMSLRGEPLRRPRASDAVRERQETELAAAAAQAAARPDDLDAQIWHGRRLAYTGRFRDAVALYTRALDRWPDEPRLLRHRGHRWITLRRLDCAVADLERAAARVAGTSDAVEADGQPNARNVPLSTLHGNIWYHLALAHYLRGDLGAAQRGFERYLETARARDFEFVHDNVCAGTYWLALIAKRLGDDTRVARLLAPIRADWHVIENTAYWRLLLAFKGELDLAQLVREARTGDDGVAFATLGYGAAAWLELSGQRTRARVLLREVVAGATWPAFGHIAAEAMLSESAAR